MRSFLCFLLLLLAACQNGEQFSVTGYLPDRTYDGEFIFLVPIENASKERVDSTVIKDGTFRFKGYVTQPEIVIIRAKPVLRIKLEELLVVKEPGKLNVLLDRSSSAGGTQLNDSLQHWKVQKNKFDGKMAEFIQELRTGNDSQKQALKFKIDSLNRMASNYHFNFASRNKDNIVGQFVQKMMSGLFTGE